MTQNSKDIIGICKKLQSVYDDEMCKEKADLQGITSLITLNFPSIAQALITKDEQLKIATEALELLVDVPELSTSDHDLLDAFKVFMAHFRKAITASKKALSRISSLNS